jgi:O-antigen chain-terminating methyltransferase
MTPHFYRAFEDRHRGSRDVIQSRLRAYLPFLRPLLRQQAGRVVDLGCGRGEWLELLGAEGIAAHGVDQDQGMLQACRERGLEVTQGDALGYLQALPDASCAAVSAFHLVEHLPFETLQTLIAQALRVLRPGGLLILETPNPENLVVGTCAFYTDPTHHKPLPPLLLSFLPEFHGFARAKTVRLQENPQLRGREPVSLLQVLAGVSPDYAVVAQKAAEGAALPELEAAFAADYGLSLVDLAERHEQQWLTRLEEARAHAQAARDAYQAAVARYDAMEARLAHELLQSQGQLRALYASDSWRAAAPLRWLSGQLQALRTQGPVRRARGIASRVVRAGVRPAFAALDRSPRARGIAGSALRAVGLGPLVAKLRTPPPAPAAPAPPPEPLPASAARILAALDRAPGPGRPPTET